ncbi:MAG: AAA family ATPase [Patescibacteria group bacterium]
MYLQKIEIQGFKSFAEPTTLVFNKELTAIVGPNGSGKSNIADAIRWVLGEQSLKLLRGKKSEDVIFAGSDTKSRLGFAKVILYLDNVDRKSDLDYDQIVIERSMNRNGESEYLVNNNKARLSDIQIMLAKASVGQKSYSVIGQGMIDTLLALSAQERRDFFDEATGVRQYQLKKSQALNKLDHTEDNLEQAELVLQELEPRLRTLSRQVRRLERKEDLEQQLIRSQNECYSFLLGNLDAELASSRAKLSKAEAAITELTRQQKDIQRRIDADEHEKGRGEAYNTLQKKLFNLQQEYNTLSKKKIVLEGQKDLELIQKGESESVLLAQRLSELENKKNSLAADIDELQHQTKKGQSLVAALEKSIRESSEKLSRIEHELAAPRGIDQSTIEATARELHDEHERITLYIERMASTDDIASFKERFRTFAGKLKSFLQHLRTAKQDTHEGLWKSFTQLNSDHKHIDQELRNEELSFGRKQHELDIARRQLSETEKEIAELSRHAEQDKDEHAISSDIREIEKTLAGKEAEVKILREQIDTFNEREEAKKQELVDLQKKFRLLQHDFTIKNNEVTALKVELAKIETKKEDLEREIAQEAPRFSRIEAGRVNEVELRERIETLKRQLNIIGGIDTETVKEYGEVKEKHDFLTQQTTDLWSAQKSLITLIKELDEHITKQFEQAFKGINTLFGKYFKRLFDGGTAKLTLNMIQEAPEDSEEADDEPEDDEKKNETEGTKPKKGLSEIKKLKAQHFDYTIDILAVPPGKKLSGINMLSGGEKAMTAIALICAIIANNPPPFVVLDEVDAALDEANSIRFAEIISELLDRSQFITITHNRATMHQAKILYGVTMGDDGISHLLSVNFSEADKLSS